MDLVTTSEPCEGVSMRLSLRKKNPHPIGCGNARLGGGDWRTKWSCDVLNPRIVRAVKDVVHPVFVRADTLCYGGGGFAFLPSLAEGQDFIFSKSSFGTVLDPKADVTLLRLRWRLAIMENCVSHAPEKMADGRGSLPMHPLKVRSPSRGFGADHPSLPIDAFHRYGGLLDNLLGDLRPRTPGHLPPRKNGAFLHAKLLGESLNSNLLDVVGQSH